MEAFLVQPGTLVEWGTYPWDSSEENVKPQAWYDTLETLKFIFPSAALSKEDSCPAV